MEKPCAYDLGDEVKTWMTGDDECNAYSTEYECGGVYNHNYMDVVGCRDHDCFWDCKECNRKNKKKAISSRKAHQIAKKRGVDIDDEQTTFYAADEAETEVYSFDTRKERDQFCR